MNEFLNAIKVDLLDRRRRPLLMIALAALIGAVAYGAIASKSSSNSSQNLGPEPAVGASGVHVTQGQSGNQAVAETTSGATQQHGGSSRDPFAGCGAAGEQSDQHQHELEHHEVHDQLGERQWQQRWRRRGDPRTRAHAAREVQDRLPSRRPVRKGRSRNACLRSEADTV